MLLKNKLFWMDVIVVGFLPVIYNFSFNFLKNFLLSIDNKSPFMAYISIGWFAAICFMVSTFGILSIIFAVERMFDETGEIFM